MRKVAFGFVGAAMVLGCIAVELWAVSHVSMCGPESSWYERQCSH